MTALLAGVLRPRNDAPVPYTAKRSGGSMFGGGEKTGPLSLAGKVGTVFSVVSRVCTATAGQEWALYRSATDGKQVQDEDREVIPPARHAAAALWAKPNPFMTTADVVEMGQQHIELAPTGDTFLVVVKAGGIPVELWPVRPDRMSPRKHPTKFLLGWTYRTPDGDEIPLDHDEVIQVVLNHDPEDPYRGTSPARALGVELDAYHAAAQWNANFFRNSAQPGGVIQLPTNLSDDKWDEFVTRWREQHQGVNNAHRVAVIEHGGQWVDRKFSMADMQFTELRKIGRDSILEAWGISRASLGVTDGVNYAAAKAADLQFAKLTTMPRLRRWQQALNHRLLPMFGATGKGVEFDFTSPVPGDEEAANAERDSVAKAAKLLIDAGFTGDSVKEAYSLPEQLVWKAKPAPVIAPPAPPAPPEQPPAVEPAAAPAALQNRALPRADDGAPDVDLTPVQQAYERHLRRLLDRIDDVRAGWRAELRRQIEAAVDGDVTDLASLTCDPAPAEEAILEGMRAIARDAAAQARREAADQGVALSIPARITASAGPVPDGDTAATLAALMAAAQALTAGSEAMRVNYNGGGGEQVAQAVDTELRQRVNAQDEAKLGGVLTGAQNRARVETFASGPVGSLYADETLDGNTCGPCRRINGRFICTTDDLAPYERLYTAMGGYVDCDGRERCRGVVTGVWRPQTTTSNPEDV